MPAINIKDESYAEFILRMGMSVDVETWINGIVDDFLERTKHDDTIWKAEEYLDRLRDDESLSFVEEYGSPHKGYYWSTQSHLLLNGTKLNMEYGSEDHIAEIKKERIMKDGTEYSSPSQFARVMANNTSRSAPRDLKIMLPGSDKWQSLSGIKLAEQKAKENAAR